MFQQIREPFSKILRGTGKHWLVSKINIQFSILGMIFGFILMEYTNYGLTGMALGWLISDTITTSVIFPYVTQKHKIISPLMVLQYLKPTFQFLTLPQIIFFIYFARVSINSWSMLFAFSTFFLIIIFIIMYLFILEERHKKAFLNFF